MEYKGHLGKVAFDEAVNVFHGEVINIRDVITFEGQSVAELRQAFQDSVEDYLEFCRERGEQPERPFSGRLTVQLSPEEHRRIIVAANRVGKRLDHWVVDVLAQAARVQLCRTATVSGRMGGWLFCYRIV